MSKIPAIITAVNRSGFLANRSMLPIFGKTVLEQIAERLRAANSVGELILCTSNEKCDDPLVALAESAEMRIVRGDYNDILSRLFQSFAVSKADKAFVIRGDAPFVDSAFLDELFKLHIDTRSELSYSEHLLGLPYGLGAIIVNLSVLERIHQLHLNFDAPHKINYLFRFNDYMIKTHKIDFDRPDPDIRFVLEVDNDYQFIKELSDLVSADAGVYDLLEVLRKHPFLKQVNRPKEEIEEIGLDKLMIFPRKTESIITNDHDESYPISVELSLTNACNLKCAWCSDKKLRRNNPAQLEFATYRRLIADLVEHGTRGLVIEGGGEPTIHPHFKEAVSFAAEQKLSLGLISNGVIFDYPELIKHFEWIRISLDADTPATYREWKGKDCFFQVLDNIKKICRIKEKCVVGVGYVVTKHNLNHLEELTSLLSDFGVNYLHLRPVIDHPDLRIEEDLFYLKKYSNETFSVMTQAMHENIITGNLGLPCLAHSLSSVVTADGSVYLCGRLNIHDHIQPLGNINHQSFHEIWLGDERKKQMKRARDEAFCHQWCPECRMTKYNIILNKCLKIKTRNFI